MSLTVIAISLVAFGVVILLVSLYLGWPSDLFADSLNDLNMVPQELQGEMIEGPELEEEEVNSILGIGLPEDFPHRKILVDNGIETYQELAEITDFTTLDKIGPSRAENIVEFITPDEFLEVDLD